MNFHIQEFTGCGGISLCADVCGNKANPPVILMHGGGQTRHSWGAAARELARMGLYAISLDLRGHGESDWAPDSNYSIDAFVGDLKAVIATLSQPVALVGASLGGAVSLVALGENHELPVSALVLVDVVPRMEREGVDRITDFMRGNPEGFSSLEDAAEAVARYLPNRRRPANNEGLKKNLRLGPNGRLHWHWDPSAHKFDRVDAQMAEMARRMDDAARHIAAPTLVVRGKLSDVVSPKGVDHLRQLIPHAVCVDVALAGHMVAGDRNDRFNSAVEDFLASVLSPDGADQTPSGACQQR